MVEKIIEREKPDAILPTLGGQTALNAAMELVKNGALERHNVRLIGANAEAIAKGEDRQLFKEAMIKIGLDVPRSGTAHTIEEGRKVALQIGAFPLIIRPAFTLGGAGGGIAYNREEFEEIVARGLDLSPVSEVLIEESLLGWKEFEMEVMRDRADNCVIICSIENLDPMGVHTGRLDHRRAGPDAHRPRISSSCATRRSRSSARSASRRAARTSSSPSIPKTAGWSSSR